MSDNSADNLDQASNLEQAFRDAALRAATQKEPVPKDWDKVNCYDCSLPMPEGRLALGAYRCVPCQTFEEKQRKLHRRNS